MSAQKRLPPEEKRSRKPFKAEGKPPEQAWGEMGPGSGLLSLDPRLAHSANLVPRTGLLQAGQRALGNQALQAALQAKPATERPTIKPQRGASGPVKVVARRPYLTAPGQLLEHGRRSAQATSAWPASLLGGIQQGEQPLQAAPVSASMAPGMQLYGPGHQAWQAIARHSSSGAGAPALKGGPAVTTRPSVSQQAPLVRLSAPAANVLQRDPNDQKQVAHPTLTVAPAAAVKRGTDVTLTVNFNPNAGETLNITGWKFTSSQGDAVNRSKKEADFQSKWQGPLVLSGTVTVDYSVQPAQGAAVAGQLSKDLQGQPRAGGVWASAVTQEPEKAFAGQPSPPKKYHQLGRHEGKTSLAIPSSTKITGGPNKGFKYIDTLTAGTYRSTPMIHPDLTNNQSNFYKFHLQGSRLYVTNGKRKLVPTAEYNNFKIAGGQVTFDVPNWQQFFQSYGVLRVKAKKGKKSITCKDAWWGLDANKRDANVVITDDNAVRQALGIGPGDAYGVDVQEKQFPGYKLIDSAALLHGTRRHEYMGAVHSHRANFLAAMRALDPQRKLEEMVSTAQHPVNFSKETKRRLKQIRNALPTHDIVDEAQTQAQESLVLKGIQMHDVNADDAGNILGDAWNIPQDSPMTN